MPTGPATPHTRGELVGAKDRVDDRAEDVHDHGHGRGGEAGVCRNQLRPARQPDEAGRTGQDRDKAECDQRAGTIQVERLRRTDRSGARLLLDPGVSSRFSCRCSATDPVRSVTGHRPDPTGNCGRWVRGLVAMVRCSCQSE